MRAAGMRGANFSGSSVWRGGAVGVPVSRVGSIHAPPPGAATLAGRVNRWCRFAPTTGYRHFSSELGSRCLRGEGSGSFYRKQRMVPRPMGVPVSRLA